MSYSKSIFGKDIFELTYQDIQDFFQDEKDENLNLEFKSYVPQGTHKEKETVIKKSVCALLNSEGGVIVWGAPVETRDALGNTKASGSLTPFSSTLDKDKLINILSSSIIPMPLDIKVQFLNDGNGNHIVIIEVPKSIERPHQFDNKYFVRLDGQTRIAPHYLIKALIQSTDFPIIRGHIRLKEISVGRGKIYLTFRKLLFNTSQFNNEKNLFMSIVAHPGNIYINRQLIGSRYDKDFSILSHGRPLMSEFIIELNSDELKVPLNIMFQFGGEKSPSKTSIYKYNILANLQDGKVKDESIYIVEKDENRLPSDVGNSSDDENIEKMLNL